MMGGGRNFPLAEGEALVAAAESPWQHGERDVWVSKRHKKGLIVISYVSGDRWTG